MKMSLFSCVLGYLLIICHLSSNSIIVNAIDPLDPSFSDEEVFQADKQNAEAQTEYPNGVNVIPGDAEIDYPIYHTIPKTSFVCDGRHPGFYADLETRCQIWHSCDVDSRMQSFLCSNGTIFSQKTRVCEWYYNVDCSTEGVNRNYEQNRDLFIIPSKERYQEEVEAAKKDIPRRNPLQAQEPNPKAINSQQQPIQPRVQQPINQAPQRPQQQQQQQQQQGQQQSRPQQKIPSHLSAVVHAATGAVINPQQQQQQTQQNRRHPGDGQNFNRPPQENYNTQNNNGGNTNVRQPQNNNNYQQQGNPRQNQQQAQQQFRPNPENNQRPQQVQASQQQQQEYRPESSNQNQERPQQSQQYNNRPNNEQNQRPPQQQTQQPQQSQQYNNRPNNEQNQRPPQQQTQQPQQQQQSQPRTKPAAAPSQPMFIPPQMKFRHSTPRQHNVKFAPSRPQQQVEERQIPSESQQQGFPYTQHSQAFSRNNYEQAVQRNQQQALYRQQFQQQQQQPLVQRQRPAEQTIQQRQPNIDTQQQISAVSPPTPQVYQQQPSQQQTRTRPTSVPVTVSPLQNRQRLAPTTYRPTASRIVIKPRLENKHQVHETVVASEVPLVAQRSRDTILNHHNRGALYPAPLDSNEDELAVIQSQITDGRKVYGSKQ